MLLGSNESHGKDHKSWWHYSHHSRYLVKILCISTKCTIVTVLILCMAYFLVIVSELAQTPSCAVSLQLPASAGCNRDPRLCERKFSDVSFATMHNAFASSQGGFVVAQHRACIATALVQGVRAFMLDVHLLRSGEIALCHVSCALGSVSVSKTLGVFREFLELNPREVVTIFWELGYDMQENPSTNETRLLRQQLNDTMHNSQLVAFAHSQQFIPFVGWPEWPTLQTMISSGKRLVIFSDSPRGNNSYSEWETIMRDTTRQTSFATQDIAGLDTACSLEPKRRSPRLVVFNHFTALGTLGINGASTSMLEQISHVKFLANINKNPFFSKRILSCMDSLRAFPSFIAVDFWESSDVLEVVDMVNSNFYFANASWHSAGILSVITTLGFV